MNPFNCSMWGIVYSNVIFVFLHTFCIFDWYYPDLSQHEYLTWVLYDINFQRNSSIFFGICDFFFIKKLQE